MVKNNVEFLREKAINYAFDIFSERFCMRKNLYNPVAEFMRYGIREIVDLAQKIQELEPGLRVIGENIGDPVAKGWNPPPFLRQMLAEMNNSDDRGIFAYSHSRGRIQAREWIVGESLKAAPHSALNVENVLFTNGLGAAISCVYHMIAPGSRIIQPLPAYPAHISMERFSAGAESIGYALDPEKNWQPDIADLESKIEQHPEIAGILVINPNNPTGSVYDAETLENIVSVAERHNLMIISDEVYFRMVFNGAKFTNITELAAGRVPVVVLRGLSKDVPWPGARCGWIELHNTDIDPEFKAYSESLKKRVMMEVCSTTLPQYIVSRIYDHPDYPAWLAGINRDLEKNSNTIADILSNTPGLRINRIQGAFYLMPVFEPGVLNERQTLPVKNEKVREFIENEVSSKRIALDKRFAYYLLAATGICVVPATDFECAWPGFRVTALERDPVQLKQTYETLSDSIKKYITSA